MFAVPGWSLSAPLKAQKDGADIPVENGTTEAPPVSKKRKRKSKGPVVTTENVAQLWEMHIEGKKPPPAPLDKRYLEKREKKQKLAELDGAKSERGRNEGLNKSNGVTSSKMDSATPGKRTQNPPQAKGVKETKKKQRKKDEKDNGRQTQATDTIEPTKLEKVDHEATPSPRHKSQKQPEPQTHNIIPSTTKLTPLQASMRAKLASARFRHLNQTLYTSPSTSALDLFTKNPEMYSEYHAGFRQQVEIWPENPVDGYVALIKTRGRAKLNRKGEVKGHRADNVPEDDVKFLPRTQGACTIADLGCGDARLSQSLQAFLQKLHMRILSFDLHSESPLVQKADIASLPLADGSVNVVIFCLALMGTNWTDFIDEAWRILHWKGELWVAEIKSRFARTAKKSNVVDHSVGKKKKKPSQMSEAQRKKAEFEQKEEDDTLAVEVDGVENAKGATDVQPFVQVLRGRGFVLDGDESEAVDLGNRMFVRMRFLKAVAPTKGKNVQPSTAVPGKMMSKTTFRGKYIRPDGEKDAGDDNAVLKPCVYKLR